MLNLPAPGLRAAAALCKQPLFLLPVDVRGQCQLWRFAGWNACLL